MKRYFILSILLSLFTLFSTPTQAGLLTGGLKEAFEYIAKKVAQESGEAAGKQAIKKAAAELGESGAKMLKKYGVDGLYNITKNKNCLKIVNSLGDNAASALAKHGDVAEDLLTKFPSDDLAKNISKMGYNETRQVNHLLSKGGTWAEKAKQHGNEALNFICRHPKFCATASLVGGAGIIWAFRDSDGATSALETALETIEWMIFHPIESVAIVLFVIFLVMCLKDFIFTIPRRLLNWIKVKLGRGSAPAKVSLTDNNSKTVKENTIPTNKDAFSSKYPNLYKALVVIGWTTALWLILDSSSLLATGTWMFKHPVWTLLISFTIVCISIRYRNRFISVYRYITLRCKIFLKLPQ